MRLLAWAPAAMASFTLTAAAVASASRRSPVRSTHMFWCSLAEVGHAPTADSKALASLLQSSVRTSVRAASAPTTPPMGAAVDSRAPHLLRGGPSPRGARRDECRRASMRGRSALAARLGWSHAMRRRISSALSRCTLAPSALARASRPKASRTWRATAS